MFTIGADPEFFIQTGKDGLMPIVGLLGGTKGSPLPVRGYRGYGLQEDNVMAEYNIPPCTDHYTFAECISTGRELVLQRLRAKLPDVAAYPSCAAMFSNEQLDNPQAQMFGCSPDFDAYNMGAPLPRINPKSLTTDSGAWRFSGGHIHLGYKDTLTWEVPDFVVAALCDLMISVSLISYGFDTQGERRRWYGSPGRYRPTSYGIEYRTLGNGWTMNSKYSVYAGMAAFSVMSALTRGEQEIRRIYNDAPWQDVRRAIADEDRTLSRQLRQYAADLGLEVA